MLPKPFTGLLLPAGAAAPPPPRPGTPRSPPAPPGASVARRRRRRLLARHAEALGAGDAAPHRLRRRGRGWHRSASSSRWKWLPVEHERQLAARDSPAGRAWASTAPSIGLLAHDVLDDPLPRRRRGPALAGAAAPGLRRAGGRRRRPAARPRRRAARRPAGRSAAADAARVGAARRRGRRASARPVEQALPAGAGAGAGAADGAGAARSAPRASSTRLQHLLERLRAPGGGWRARWRSPARPAGAATRASARRRRGTRGAT